MYWVLQDNLFREEGYYDLINALHKHGLPFSVHTVVPFSHELSQPLPSHVNHNNVICFGSHAMRNTARIRGWVPGVFDLEAFDFTEQLKHWGVHMLNCDAVVSTLEASVFPYGITPYFVRPTSDSKLFDGRVMFNAEFTYWKRTVLDSIGLDGSGITKETLIQIAPYSHIDCEVRCWVVKGKIVTASVYKKDRKLYSAPASLSSPLVRFAQERVDEWQPLDAFVIDVCSTPLRRPISPSDIDTGMRIVEINTLNSSGFYAGDLDLLVRALTHSFSTT